MHFVSLKMRDLRTFWGGTFGPEQKVTRHFCVLCSHAIQWYNRFQPSSQLNVVMIGGVRFASPPQNFNIQIFKCIVAPCTLTPSSLSMCLPMRTLSWAFTAILRLPWTSYLQPAGSTWSMVARYSRYLIGFLPKAIRSPYSNLFELLHIKIPWKGLNIETNFYEFSWLSGGNLSCCKHWDNWGWSNAWWTDNQKDKSSPSRSSESFIG